MIHCEAVGEGAHFREGKTEEELKGPADRGFGRASWARRQSPIHRLKLAAKGNPMKYQSSSYRPIRVKRRRLANHVTATIRSGGYQFR